MQCKSTTKPRGITINADVTSEGRPIAKSKAKAALKIRTRKTLIDYLKTLGMFGQSALSWEDLKLLFALRLWTQINTGDRKFSKQNFAKCLQAGITPEQLLWKFEIDLNQKFEDFKNGIHQW